jgi:hypothetical protein
VDTTGLVGDQQVKHGPDRRAAVGLAGEPAIIFVRRLTSSRPLEQASRAPPSSVAQRIAQVDYERVQVIGQAARGGGEPFLVELLDERLNSLFSDALVTRFIQRLPVGVLTLGFAARQLGVQVPRRGADTSALTVCRRTALRLVPLTTARRPETSTSWT